MATNVSNIQIGHGVVNIKKPADAGSWRTLGGLSEDGVRIRATSDRYNVFVADGDICVKSKRQRLEITLEFEVVEATLQGLADALGIPDNRVDGTAGTLTITDEDVGEIGIQFVGEDVDGGELKKWEFPKCVLTPDLEISLQKGGEVRIPFSVYVLGEYDETLGAYKIGTVSKAIS
mgnify:CR=1 FL=1